MSLITEKQTKRILVVDDIEDNLFLMQLLLETQGYQVDTAQSGQAALDRLHIEGIPDLIILDLMMPGMNGYEVIDYLRNQDNLPDIPILLVTANTSVNHQQANEAGANEVLYKPLDIKQFLTKVELFNT